LATRDELSITDLRDEEFVAHAGHGRSVMNSVLTAMCADAGFVPRLRHEVEETSTLVTLVAAGLGVAIVPDPTAALDIAGVRYRPLIPDRLGVDLVAARAVQANSPLIERVLTILRQVARPSGHDV
jgi:DNA-binding transcriptional LysR family regulator